MDILSLDRPNLLVGFPLKRLAPQRPDLIHHTAKAPHITGCGIGLVMESLLWEWDITHEEVGGAQTSGAVHLTGIFPPFDL